MDQGPDHTRHSMFYPCLVPRIVLTVLLRPCLNLSGPTLLAIIPACRASGVLSLSYKPPYLRFSLLVTPFVRKVIMLMPIYVPAKHAQLDWHCADPVPEGHSEHPQHTSEIR